jgi:hypothetical protein
MQCLNACHEFLRLVLPYPASSAVAIPTRTQEVPGLNLARIVRKKSSMNEAHSVTVISKTGPIFTQLELYCHHTLTASNLRSW